MNIGRLLGKAVRYAKANPEKVLVVASLIAPGVVAKVVPKIVPLIVADKQGVE